MSSSVALVLFYDRMALTNCRGLCRICGVTLYTILQNALYVKMAYITVSKGCGIADEHTEHSAVAEWDAAYRSAPTLRLSVCSSALQHLCNNSGYKKVYIYVKIKFIRIINYEVNDHVIK